MIKRITGFIERTMWLSAYIGSPLMAVVFLLQRRRDPDTRAIGRVNGQSFSFRGADLSAVREVLTHAEYDFLTSRLKAKKVPVIYDIGAHIGLFALWCLQQNPAAKLFSLEANPSTYTVLVDNIKARGLPDWTAINRAAWRNNDWLSFDSNRESMSSHVTTSGQIKVQGIDWATLTQSWPTPIDIMKIDIEGAEESFITAAPAMLDCVECLVIELHPNRCDTAAVMKILEEKYASITTIGGRTSSKPLLLCEEPRDHAASQHSAHA